MNTVHWWLAQNTITVAVLIPFVAAACRLCRNRPAVAHVLWAVVLLKFVTPPLVSWPWPVQYFSPPLWSILAPALGSRLSNPNERRAFAFDDIPIETKAREASGDIRRFSNSVPVEAAGEARSVARDEVFARVALGLLTAVWFLGVVVCTARQLRRIGRHASLVRHARKAPEQLMREIEAMAMQVGLRPPRALVTRGIVSPFMWFLGRLRLLWPETMSGRDEVARSRGVIAHELAHVRRGDHYLAWVELLAGLLWWWNPLFWFVRRRVRESAELACDAIALAACPESRRTYAELLLELSSGPGSASLAPALGIRAGTPSSFERRLSMILSDRVSGRVPLWGFVAAAALAFAALPGWSLAQKPAENTSASSDETASQVEQDGRATSARLEQIEAELQRLSLLLKEAKRSPANQPRATAGIRQPVTPRWRKYTMMEPAHPSYVFVKSDGRKYVVSTKEKHAVVSALDKEGRQIWQSQFQLALPVGESGDWALNESEDEKQVVITWDSKGERTTFRLDAASGKTLTETTTGGDDLGFDVTVRRKHAPDNLAETVARLVNDQPRQEPLEPDRARLNLLRRYEAVVVTDVSDPRHDSRSVAEKLRTLNTSGSDHRNAVERLLKLKQTDEELTRAIFRSLLNRNPTRDELSHATKHLATAASGASRGSAVEDIFWAIINSHEYQSGQKPQPARK